MERDGGGITALPRELLREIRRIEIRTSRLVTEAFAGRYHSVFKGMGIEFAEVREYQPGDDVRTIDWNVTARMGHPYVKRYVEERELRLLLVVDLSGSGEFGTRRALKNRVAAELSALLAYSAIRNNDRVGLVIFTDEVELYLPPKKGSRHILRLIREILGFRARSRGTNLSGALEYVGNVGGRHAIVFVISDFLTAGYERVLGVLARRNDVIAVELLDPGELGLVSMGMVELCDPETGERVVVDTQNAAVRRLFRERMDELRRRRHEQFRRAGVDWIELWTDRSYVEPLAGFFRMRERRLRRV